MTISNPGIFFTHHSFGWSFYHTIFYCPLIYARLTIYMENFLLLHPLIASLALKQMILFIFGFFVARMFVSGYIQMYTSGTRHCHFHRCQPHHHSLSPVVVFHSLTSASPAVACHPVVYFAFLSPLLAS